MTRPKSFILAIFLISALGPEPALSADTSNTKAGSEVQAGEEAPACHKRIFVKGHAKKALSIARLSAVRSWTEKAKNHGDEYSMWHYAQKPNIKCKALTSPSYYLCFAMGKPCRKTNSGKTAANKTQ
jgi:hypothetical protein